jgi:hypothetical protein
LSIVAVVAYVVIGPSGPDLDRPHLSIIKLSFREGARSLLVRLSLNGRCSMGRTAAKISEEKVTPLLVAGSRKIPAVPGLAPEDADLWRLDLHHNWADT